MKASKELYSELFKEYILSSRDIRELQVVLYGMLEKVCFLLDNCYSTSVSYIWTWNYINR